ncbi:hypothetical protein tinsulaeT_05920 [Thalassotalea insulae]|uniref:PNPLA domain-containing protein n=1 Tax=Thalassotalea insulae TaxID=2056778 RepID=A0ABQ6GRJ7_9GAMM|nr:patatin-like phospholipase family protein [Thalassotalea insulae]GLX77252.1 hypothetical protein tinsulaeT_05920 [Thalassotalea insulae]
MIEIFAGKTALNTIKEQGFKQELFSTFLGASGGPKWFILYQLDRYLFGEFFHGRTQTLNILGSSAGAFRAACFAQEDPVAAIERLATHYSQTVYSAKANAAEITTKAKELLALMLGEHGEQEIINNPIFKAHFIVAKSNGFTASENKWLQGAGLFASYGLNRLNRKLLRTQYQRFVFQPQSSNLSFSDPSAFTTKQLALTGENLQLALLASGSIPLVMQGVKDIPGSPPGMYRDGGIIDYHFDIKIDNPGLVLYPHFNAQPKAGWFDKNLKRQVTPKNYDNVVLVCPSKKFIASLPYGKIPDRNDFTEMQATTRIKYWQTVLAQTEQMAQQLAAVIETQALDCIQPFVCD